MNFIFKYLIFVVFLLGSVNTRAQSELDEYLNIATKNNAELKQAFNEYMASLQKIPQVKSLPNPTIAFAYLAKPVETRMGPQEYLLGISQMFPWFGTLKTKGNIANEMAKAKYEAFLEIKSDIINKVRSAYYNLYFNNKASNITNENIQLLLSIQKLALIKVEAGLVSAVDEYRIEMELNDLRNSLSTINNNRVVLTKIFYNLLNTKERINIKYPNDLGNINVVSPKTSLLDSIKANNHKLLAIEMQINASIESRVLAKKAGMPSFTIGADYISIGKGDKNLPGDDAFIFPKIGISIPIYRNKYKALEKEAYYNELAKREQQINMTNMIENLFEGAWKDYIVANDNINLYESQIQLAKKTLSILESSYAASNSKFEEFIRMQRRLLMYSLSLENAKVDKHKAVSYIFYLTASEQKTI